MGLCSSNKATSSKFSSLFLEISASASFPDQHIPGRPLTPSLLWPEHSITVCGKAHWQVLSHSLLLVTAYSYFLLTEHEHPYDIIMRNSLNAFSRRESRNFTAFPALPGLYVEQPDIQGRFILKPREAARCQKQSGESIHYLPSGVLSQFQFLSCEKHQCIVSFLGSKGGTVENKDKKKTICPQSCLREFELLQYLACLWGEYLIIPRK